MTDTANAPERIWAWPHGYRVVAPEGSDDITQYRWVPNFDVTDIGEGQAWTAPTPQMPGATKYVLATHCDELVAAAYLDAARVPTVFLVGDPPNGIPFRSPMAHEVAEAIEDRTPDDAHAALTAYGERMKADGAKEERKKWQKSVRDTFDAMCAMRDAINEHVPMPSLESDLLHGPENSVFCAAVAESVIESQKKAQAKIARLTEALNDIIMCDHHNFYDGPPPRFVQIARAALQENANG